MVSSVLGLVLALVSVSDLSSNRVSDSPGGGGWGPPCIKIGYSGFFQEMGSPPPF